MTDDHEHCVEIGRCWQDRYPCPALVAFAQRIKRHEQLHEQLQRDIERERRERER